MKNCRPLLYLACATVFITGCSGNTPEQMATIRGLQEENKVLRARIAGLENEQKTSKQEVQALKQDAKKDFEEHVAKLNEYHRSRIAQLDGEIATLRLELGAIQREKLAMQEILDREPRMELAHRDRYQIELIVMGVLLLMTLLLLGYVALRYRIVRDRLNHLVMERVSELRMIGGSHEQGH
jgi:outer membrane murein-binding lipoprotein Lpp